MYVKGVGEVKADLDRIATNCRNGRWLEEATNFVAEEARRMCAEQVKFGGDLVSSIDYEFRKYDDSLAGIVYTDSPHAIYFEFGTGPIGRANHSGISPQVTPAYRDKPWTVSVAQAPGLSAYGFKPKKYFVNGVEEERYFLKGQPAHPFMYPALANNTDRVLDIANHGLDEALKG